MVKQKVPDLEFGFFVLAEMQKLFDEDKIKINSEYQRGDIWKHKQMIELIQSIENRYSIGVLVLFINDKGQYEILDGQQRLMTIRKYLTDSLDLNKTEIVKYSELDVKEKALIDAYCVYYLKLKSYNEETKEEDITQTFLRLQEGTPLNKAEKINAYRGKFKDTFRELRDTHQLFTLIGKDKRFRLRLLAAEFLLLELKSDFEHKVFPSLDFDSFKSALKEYETEISSKTIKFLKGNLDFLHSSLNLLLTAIPPREIITFYLLISYLRKFKAENSNLMNEFGEFAEQFFKNVNSFSIYDTVPPAELTKELFEKYFNYKNEARKATSSDSIEFRFNFILEEYNRLYPFIQKDQKRLYDVEQKRTLFFRQKGICPECNKKIDFGNCDAHHTIPHSEGGKTDNLNEAVLLHKKCHERLEKRVKKEKSLVDSSS